MHRPNEKEFLQEVLRGVEDLPQELAQRLLEAIEGKGLDRAEVIRKLFEDFGRG
jgi:hypothetical protein